MKKHDARSLRWLARWIKILFFAYRKRPSLTVFTVSALVGFGYFLCFCAPSPQQELAEQFKQAPASTFFQGTVLLAAVSIWVFQVVQDWKSELPKYISVDFVYQGRPRIRCQYAALIGESDARGMAQSLGQAVNCGKRLPIAPILENIVMKEMIDRSGQLNNGQPFMHYSVTIRMTENVTKLGLESPQRREHDEKMVSHEGVCLSSEAGILDFIPQDRFVCWSWPFEPPTEKDLVPYNVNQTSD